MVPETRSLCSLPECSSLEGGGTVPDLKSAKKIMKKKCLLFELFRADTWESVTGLLKSVKCGWAVNPESPRKQLRNGEKREGADADNPQRSVWKVKRKELKTRCCDLQNAIFEDIFSKPYEQLEAQRDAFKESYTDWLKYRLLLKPDVLDKAETYFFPLSLSVVKARLRILRAYEKLEAELQEANWSITSKGGIFYLSMRARGELKRFAFHGNSAESNDLLKKLPEIIAKGSSNFLEVIESTTVPSKQPVCIEGQKVEVQSMPLYTLQQQQKLMECEDYRTLDAFFALPIKYKFVTTHLLFADRARFTQQQINAAFLKCIELPGLMSLPHKMLPYVSFKDGDVASKALRFVLDHHLSDAHRIRMECPDVDTSSLTEANLLALIEFRFYVQAASLLKGGMCAKVKIEEPLNSCCPIVQTPIGCLIKSIGGFVDEKTEKKIIGLAELLLASGANANQQISSDGISEFECTVLEKCYFESKAGKDNAAVFEKLFKLLLDNGGKITPRLARNMLLDIKGGERVYAPSLVSQGYATEEQIDFLLGVNKPDYVQTGECIQQCLDATVYLQDVSSRFHLRPFDLDFTEISKIRSLKKKMKSLLFGAPKQAEFLALSYRNLCAAYDKVVENHLLLSELQSISREVRSFGKKTGIDRLPSNRLIRFYGLWSPEQSSVYEAASRQIQRLLSSNRNVLFDELRTNALTAIAKASKDFYLSRHPIVFLHGTSSRSLPVILKLGKLIGLGTLLKEGVPTFGGEVCGTDNNLNLTQLSGERLTYSWNEGRCQWNGALTRVHCCYTYAVQHRAVRPHERVFSSERCWERASVEYVQRLIDPSPLLDVSSHGSWTTVRLDILRLRSIDSTADRRLEDLKRFILEKLESRSLSQSTESELNCLKDALEKKLSLFFNEGDLELVKDPSPFGIIFASTTLYSKPHDIRPEPMEFVAEGPIDLERQVQVAFTSAERVEQLKELLKPFCIRVYDFETAFALEMMQMIRGQRVQESVKTKAKADVKCIQEHLSFVMQQDILPAYAAPFPYQPKYTAYAPERKRLPVEKPLYSTRSAPYSEYVDKVKGGVLLPRSIHGTMHAVRTSIWAQLVYKLYERENLFANESLHPLLLALAAAAHDWNRQDEGEDHWDLSSAKRFKGYLLANMYDEEETAPYYHALSQKDPNDRRFTSLAQRCIHDADVLEIRRVLRSSSDFRKTELCFYQELQCQDFDKEKLLLEIEEFILMTEDFELKKELEEKSSDYYGDVMRLIRRANQQQGLYPIISLLMKEEIEAFKF